MSMHYWHTHLYTTKPNNKEEKQPEIKHTNLIIHHAHEKRFSSFKRDMHHVCDTVFQNTPVADVKIIVGNRNRPKAKNELIRKRPKQTLLKSR